MNKFLVAILCIAMCVLFVSAGEKVLTFSGLITAYNDENRSLVAKNDKKELSFFVAGKIIRNSNNIEMVELRNGCQVTITYQKNRDMFVASRVEVNQCQ